MLLLSVGVTLIAVISLIGIANMNVFTNENTINVFLNGLPGNSANSDDDDDDDVDFTNSTTEILGKE